MTKNSPDPIEKSDEDLLTLREAINTALSSIDVRESADEALYLLGRTILQDDLNSIIVLCANSLSMGANQILRGMFERVVTLSYLHENPGEIGSFLNYFWVEQHKMINDVPEESGEPVSRQRIDEAKSRFSEVSEDYMFVACERCRNLRLNDRWSVKDISTMAREVGVTFPPFIEAAQYYPFEQVRPRTEAVLRRIVMSKEGAVWFNELPDLETPDFSVYIAYWLTLHTLSVLKEHFSIDDFEGPLSRCISDFYFLRVG